MDGAYTGAGQHGVDGLGNHRHVDTHPVTFLDATTPEGICQPTDLVVQFPVGDVGVVCGIVAFPDNGRSISAVIEMTIDTVVASVKLTADEPLCLAPREVGLRDFLPGFEPCQHLVGLLRPEFFRAFDRGLVHRLVFVWIDERLRFQLLTDGIDFIGGHACSLTSGLIPGSVSFV